MTGAQKSELLTTLRTKSELGQKFIEDVLKNAVGSKIMISGLSFKKESLKECESTLDKAKTASSIRDIKRLLKEDTIPMGLLYKEKFWQEFQDSINLLYKT